MCSWKQLILGKEQHEFLAFLPRVASIPSSPALSVWYFNQSKAGYENQQPCCSFQNIPFGVFSVKVGVPVVNEKTVAPLSWVCGPLWDKQWTSDLAGNLTGNSGRSESHQSLVSTPYIPDLPCAWAAEMSMPKTSTYLWPTEPACTHRRDVRKPAESKSWGRHEKSMKFECAPQPTESEAEGGRFCGSRCLSKTSD